MVSVVSFVLYWLKCWPCLEKKHLQLANEYFTFVFVFTAVRLATLAPSQIHICRTQRCLGSVWGRRNEVFVLNTEQNLEITSMVVLQQCQFTVKDWLGHCCLVQNCWLLNCIRRDDGKVIAGSFKLKKVESTQTRTEEFHQTCQLWIFLCTKLAIFNVSLLETFFKMWIFQHSAGNWVGLDIS